MRPATYRLAWMAVVGLALCVRFVHLRQALDGPAPTQHRWTESDMYAFDVWASNIADGDLLSRRIQRPLTTWHHDVARMFLELRPEGIAGVPGTADALWTRWHGPPRFFQEPLYPYALAAVRRWLGADVGLVFLLQSLLSVAAVAAAMDATRRLVGPREALVTGALAALCAPLLYFDTLLLRESLTMALVWLTVWLWSRPRHHAVVLALACGAAVLTRMTLVPLLLLLAWRSIVRSPNRGRAVFAWAAGLALPLGLFVARNLVVGESALAMPGAGPFVFFTANARTSNPAEGLIIDRPLLAQLLADSGGAPTHLTWQTLAGHDLGSFVWLQLAKVAALLHAHEIPNNASFSYYAAHASVLRFLPVTFGILPLGLAGAWLGRRRARVLVEVAAIQALPLLVLQPLSRYRAGLLSALLPLAALALVAAYDAWRAGQQKRLVLASIGVLATWAWMHRPLDVLPIRGVDHAVAWSFWARPQLDAAMARGDRGAVANTVRAFLRAEPGDLADPDPKFRADRRWMARIYGEAHRRLAEVEATGGDMRSAAAELERAERLLRIAR